MIVRKPSKSRCLRAAAFNVGYPPPVEKIVALKTVETNPRAPDLRSHAAKHALIVINRKARRGLESPAPSSISFATPVSPSPRKRPGPGRTVSDLIRSHASLDLAIVGGGDGTLNSAAAGLVETGMPLGVIPLGTANDFARTVGIPLDPLKAAELIVSGAPPDIDLGEVNGHFFFNVASIGFSAELAGNSPSTPRSAGASSATRWSPPAFSPARGSSPPISNMTAPSRSFAPCRSRSAMAVSMAAA